MPLGPIVEYRVAQPLVFLTTAILTLWVGLSCRSKTAKRPRTKIKARRPANVRPAVTLVPFMPFVVYTNVPVTPELVSEKACLQIACPYIVL